MCIRRIVDLWSLRSGNVPPTPEVCKAPSIAEMLKGFSCKYARVSFYFHSPVQRVRVAAVILMTIQCKSGAK